MTTLPRRSILKTETRSAEETERLGAAIARDLRGGDVVGLQGELGAGKTCFVRGMARGLGLPESSVSSPTFVLVHEYVASRTAANRAEHVAVDRLVHVDAYRMSGPEDLAAIGWDEILASHNVIVAVEWPDRIADAMPPDRVDVRIDHIGANRRQFEITALGSLATLEREWSAAGNDPASSNASRSGSSCPTCGRSTDPAAKSFPFCSLRCRMVDLGKWIGGKYRVSRATDDSTDDGSGAVGDFDGRRMRGGCDL